MKPEWYRDRQYGVRLPDTPGQRAVGRASDVAKGLRDKYPYGLTITRVVGKYSVDRVRKEVSEGKAEIVKVIPGDTNEYRIVLASTRKAKELELKRLKSKVEELETLLET
jgi:hypothetical protein